MKKIKSLLCIFLSFFLITTASANDYSVGFYSWYADWKVEDTERFPVDEYASPGIMFGPFLEVGLTDNLSVSALFLMGSFEREKEKNSGGGAPGGSGGGPGPGPGTGPGGGGSTPEEFAAINGIFFTLGKDVKRYDVDLCLNYDLTKYIRPFAGMKLLYFDFPMGDADGYHKSLGGAVGLGLTVPLLFNFYLLGNGSLLYSMGKHKTSDPNLSGQSMGNEPKPDANFTEQGFNIALSLSYHVVPWAVTLSIGGRLQAIKVKYKDVGEDFKDIFEDGSYRFQGITASAVKSF